MILFKGIIIGFIVLGVYSTGVITVQVTNYTQWHRTHLLILGNGLLLLVSVEAESGAILLKATDSLTFPTSLEAPY